MSAQPLLRRGYGGAQRFAAPAAVEVMIWASAIIRIAVCLLPQNN